MELERTPANENAPRPGGIFSTLDEAFERHTQVARPWQFPRDLTTLHARVGADLATGDQLTTHDILLRYGHSRGSDSILKLRKLGWIIQTEMLEVPTSDGSRRARIGRYWITQRDIEAASEPLQMFIAGVNAAIDDARRSGQ